MTDTTTTHPTWLPPGIHPITPYICVTDSAAAIDFYVAAFGAEERGERFVDPDGRVGHAEIAISGAHLYLSDPYPAFGCAAPSPDEPAAVSLTLYVPDVDAAVAKAVELGARLDRPIEDAFYGTRRATLTDPFGHRWMVGTHVRDVSAEEIEGVVERYAESGSED